MPQWMYIMVAVVIKMLSQYHSKYFFSNYIFSVLDGCSVPHS